jgi:hypothetical protein
VGSFKIALWGAGDLELPTPQRAEAKANAPNTVTMTLYCASDENRGGLKPVTTQLASTMACDLAIRLWLAADDSECPPKG